MGGDYSRQTFDPRKDFSAVLKQQGRVDLDADWNEYVDLQDRRWRAETIDIIGRCTVPKETPEGFRITIDGNTLTIGRGRMYVDGLLAENHGTGTLEFDPVLAEQRGADPTPYDQQPYFPDVSLVAPAPTGGGPHLVYLDVWQREVTSSKDPGLVEKAVGVDTTTRLQTVWQVKILPDVGEGVSCDSELQAWNDLTAPSTGRLSTAAVGISTEDELCTIPPSGGYRGAENQLYRVEIHDGGEAGQAGTATFKWSRDNASVVASIVAITDLNKLTVASVGHDRELRLNAGDWIEITDDHSEFAGQPGVSPQPASVMGQIKSVDDTNRILTLMSPIPPNIFNTDPQGNTDPARHTRVRRWDQSGQVRDTNGNLLVDLNASGSKGVIPVPATGASIVLEDGVQITFDTPVGGKYKIGDYWNFAARTADASVEQLKQAPPLGVHHHFCRLALVTFPNSVTDCRTLWPPDFGGEGCECTVCVTAESHNGGTLTIQMAIDRLKAAGGGTICLGVGEYNLGNSEIPINITGARSIDIRGEGMQTLLVYTGSGPAVRVDNSVGITIEKLKLETSAIQSDTRPAILFANMSRDVTLQRCLIRRRGTGGSSAVVGLTGFAFCVTIRENMLIGPIGIGNLIESQAFGTPLSPPEMPFLFTKSLYIQNNTLLCNQRGISFEGDATHMIGHMMESRLAGNSITGCARGGIVALGFIPAAFSLNVHGNELLVDGSGITIGGDGARITANSISAKSGNANGAGIVLATGLDTTGIDQCHVVGNRINGISGIGISVEAALKSAIIKNNFVDGAHTGGVVMGEKSSADSLTIENNQIRNVVAQTNQERSSVVGIRLADVKHGAVVNNVIERIGLEAPDSRCAGIQLLASSSARISGNDIADIAPPSGNTQICAGIEVTATFDQVEIVNNNVRRSRVLNADADGTRWHGVLISGGRTPPQPFGGIRLFFAERNSTEFRLTANRILARPVGRESVLLQANFLDVYGSGAAFRTAVSGPCTISDNRCFLRTNEQGPPTLDVECRAAVVNANSLEGTGESSLRIRLRPESDAFTVLGNITNRDILVNGENLKDPWKPLNVRTP